MPFHKVDFATNLIYVFTHTWMYTDYFLLMAGTHQTTKMEMKLVVSTANSSSSLLCVCATDVVANELHAALSCCSLPLMV